MNTTAKKFLIKRVLGESILSKNEYGTYSFRYVIDMFDETILFFQTREDAKMYIYEHNLKEVTILEIFA